MVFESLLRELCELLDLRCSLVAILAQQLRDIADKVHALEADGDELVTDGGLLILFGSDQLLDEEDDVLELIKLGAIHVLNELSAAEEQAFKILVDSDKLIRITLLTLSRQCIAQELDEDLVDLDGAATLCDTREQVSPVTAQLEKVFEVTGLGRIPIQCREGGVIHFCAAHHQVDKLDDDLLK